MVHGLLCPSGPKTHIETCVWGGCVHAQSCPTLFDPMDSSPPGSSMGFSRQEYWSGLLFPPTGHTSPVSPALQVDSYHLSNRGSLHREAAGPYFQNDSGFSTMPRQQSYEVIGFFVKINETVSLITNTCTHHMLTVVLFLVL